MKNSLNIFLAAVILFTVNACGGGGDVSQAAYTTRPTVTSASATTSASGSSVVLTAAATDNVGIAGYCFTTSSAQPSASDACFQTASSKTINAPDSSVDYYAWAKNALGVVNASPRTITIYVPTVVSANATVSVSDSNIVLSASAVDANSITGYCFSTTNVKPSATDACFQTANTKSIAGSSAVGQYYAWAKNSSGLVAGTAISASPCSTAGIAASNASQLKTVCMLTTLGEMVFELEHVRAPGTVTNFLKYVNSGFYADTIFHRVEEFVIQGGGFTSPSAMKTPTYAAIPLEAPTTTGVNNLAGTLGMARTPALDSATSQFFINIINNSGFDRADGYAAFGRVISGSNTVNAIKSLAVNGNVPTTPPVIRWAVQLK